MSPRHAVWIATLIVALMVLGTLPTVASPERLVAGPRTPSTSSGSALASVRPAVPAEVPWLNLSPAENGSAPPAGAFGNMVYDAADAEWVYFGGCGFAQCPNNVTWVFRDQGWTNITDPARAPPARYGAMMDYDPNAGGVLLYGGLGLGDVGLNSTWLFHDGVWTNVGYLDTPPVSRYFGTMAFDPDPAINGSVLFGGCAAGSTLSCFNDTWVWHPGSGWTELTYLVSPPVRGDAMMTYDSSDNYLVLFGGYGNCASGTCYYRDVWEFYANNWWALAPTAASPTSRELGSITNDPAAGGVLLFGGANGTTGATYAETWVFAHGHWTNLTGATAPPGRFGAALSPDSAGLPPLLFGGFAAGLSASFNDTWVGEAVPSATFVTSSAGSTVTVEAGAPTTLSVSVIGGTGPYTVTVDFGDGSGAAQNGSGPDFTFPHVFGQVQNVIAQATITDLFGAATAAVETIEVVHGPTVIAAAAVPSGDIGLAVHFTSVPGAGSSLSGFLWSFGDAPGLNETGQNVSHTFTTAGTWAVEVSATDTAGATATASLTFPVSPLPTATIVAPTGTPKAGSGIALQATVQGGSAPFSYAWSFGDGGKSTVPSPAHVYAAAGTFSAQVWVNDSAGGSAHASVQIQVAAGNATSSPGSSTSSGAATIPTWYWAALGAIVVATVIGAALLLRGGRRS